MYLLSTQSLMDLLTGDVALRQFVNMVPRDRLFVSAVSLGLVEESIRETQNATERDQLDLAFRAFLSVARHHGCIEQFSESTALAWARLSDYVLEDEDGDELSDVDKMVIATAIDRTLILVDEQRPFHQQLANLRTHVP